MTTISRQSITDPLTVDDTVFRHAVAWAEAGNGALDHCPDELEALMPYMQIFAVGEGESRYLWCGTQSTVGRLYPNFCKTALGTQNIPDVEIDQLLSRDYVEVRRTGQRVTERIETVFKVEGDALLCDYTRVVFPMTLWGLSAVGLVARFCRPPTRLR